MELFALPYLFHSVPRSLLQFLSVISLLELADSLGRRMERKENNSFLVLGFQHFCQVICACIWSAVQKLQFIQQISLLGPGCSRWTSSCRFFLLDNTHDHESMLYKNISSQQSPLPLLDAFVLLYFYNYKADVPASGCLN